MTYKHVQESYRMQHGMTVKTCWIADVKRKYNATNHTAHNRGDEIKHPCPEHVFPKLEKVMHECGMI